VNGDTNKDGDLTKEGSVFTIGSDTNRNLDVTISGMTITGGTGTSVLVRDNDANRYISGGGILNYGGLTVSDTAISENAAYYGAGIFNKGTLNLNSGTSIAQNSAYDGGGIYNQGGAGSIALVNLNGCSIEDNRAEQLGAGIYSAGNTLNMYSSTTISGNTAGNNGGGIYLAPSYYVMNMYGGNIFGNHATSSGGGIFSYGGNVYLNGGNIYSNTAMNGAGFVNGGGWTTLDGTKIYDNTANKVGYGYGGGIMNSGILTLTSGSIDHNTAFTDGGGVWNNVAGTVSGNRLLVHDNTLISGASDNISP
jgi:hypothetical protein